MQEYKNEKLIVRYDPGICIHAGECVRGLPSVFNVSKNPWIDVNGASPAAIIEQVKECPSGALTYEVAQGRPLKPLWLSPWQNARFTGSAEVICPRLTGMPPRHCSPNGTQEAPRPPARGFFL
jgi:uncharacterized Fe-S cluster protein YjdI